MCSDGRWSRCQRPVRPGGELHALASRLAFSHLRLDEHLHNRPVIARQPDLAGAAEVLAQAAGLSARLALDLTNAAAGAMLQETGRRRTV